MKRVFSTSKVEEEAEQLRSVHFLPNSAEPGARMGCRVAGVGGVLALSSGARC